MRRSWLLSGWSPPIHCSATLLTVCLLLPLLLPSSISLLFLFHSPSPPPHLFSSSSRSPHLLITSFAPPLLLPSSSPPLLPYPPHHLPFSSPSHYLLITSFPLTPLISSLWHFDTIFPSSLLCFFPYSYLLTSSS